MKQTIMRKNGIGRFDIAKASIRERQILAILFSIKSALFGTQAVVLAKSLSMLLLQILHPSPAYSNPLLSYQTYFIFLGCISAATYWVTRLNHGLRLFDAVYLVPMMQICWIIFSTLAGGIYYEEFVGYGQKEYAAYAVGFACVLVGVGMLCPRDDGVRSLNAADVIYDIVTDENAKIAASEPTPRFRVFENGDEPLATEDPEDPASGGDGEEPLVGGRRNGYRKVKADDAKDDAFAIDDDDINGHDTQVVLDRPRARGVPRAVGGK